MSTIVTRAGKGSPLTNNELDANFNNLNTDKLETGSLSVTTTAAGTAGLAYASNVFYIYASQFIRLCRFIWGYFYRRISAK